MKKMCDIKKSFIGLVFLAGRSNFERGGGKLRLLSWLVIVATLLTEGFSYDLKNGFGKCSLFVLSVNG